METIYSDKHKLRDAKTELDGGQLVYPFERPSRAETVLTRVKKQGLGEVSAPIDFGMEPIEAVHDGQYLNFLKRAWQQWKNEGYEGEAIANIWPARRMMQTCPNAIDGQLGYYALAAETSITQGTWEAAYSSAQVALTGAKRLIDGEDGAFGLCRPPGHHAAFDLYGGYCFLNNAAIAAEYLRSNGAGKVAILDVDFHHGNGTQDIFYTRDDVYFASIHGDPMEAFPHFLGFANETGQLGGEGCNLNLPLPRGTGFAKWREALHHALIKIANFAPDALIVSLGVDTFENDPISFFQLTSDDFIMMGADIANANLPCLFVMEGGYDVDEIGINTVNVLEGFEGT